jgi:hypothetical protein
MASPPAPDPSDLTLDPSFALVQAANDALSDKDLRDNIREMHAQGYSLVKMVEALALDDEMERVEHLREIIENLSPEVVEQIRAATLEMLDRGESALPIDCTVTPAEVGRGVPVDVAVVEENKVNTIFVRARSDA